MNRASELRASSGPKKGWVRSCPKALLATLGIAASTAIGACSEPESELAPLPPLDADRLPPLPDGPAGFRPAFERLPALEYPTEMIQAPGDPEHWYVLEQAGRVRRFRDDPTVEDAALVLDIADRVVGPDENWESGLVGLAFHPGFESNRHLYLFYSTPSTESPVGSRIVVSRFLLPDDSASIDPASEVEVLSIQARHLSYNGGTLRFGPDGYLYIGSGQNILSEARPHPSQDPQRLEGKILRIDVDAGDPYGIPPDNPFAAGGGAPEVFAYGFRNPWKFSFDPRNGRLFAGDVGHQGFEEINLILPGRNYGYAEFEGDTCHEDCPPAYEPPIHAYPGPVATVIAGEVYRGQGIASLRGAFVFADFMRAELWALREEGDGWHPTLLMKTGKALRTPGMVGTITSFASDEAGRLFALTRSGRIIEIVSREEMLRYYATRMAESP
jgi:glucose/arabinose dehydrogenase